MEDKAINNGRRSAGPASEQNHTLGTFGLTKREYFAAMAVQGLLAHSGFGETHADIAQNAVMLADALLLELEKTAQQ